MTTIFLDFTDPNLWDFDNDDIEIINDVAKLKLSIRILQYFQSFNSIAGFIYNPAKSEIIISEEVLRQVDQKPLTALCWASYGLNIDLSWGDGLRTGTPVGSVAPVINNRRLDLTGGNVRYVNYNAFQNAQLSQVWTIKFKIKPDYLFSPPSKYTFFSISEADGSSNNLIQLSHMPLINRTLLLEIKDFQGADIVDETVTGWAGDSTDPVEIQVNADLNSGVVRYFRNGSLVRQIIATGIRDTNISLLRIGSDYDGNKKADFFIEDFIVYNSVQNTSSYTPGYELADYRYLEDLITLPLFQTIGNIQQFLNFITVQDGAIRFNINQQYWDGANWVTSDDSPSQMNNQIDINTNIDQLAPSAQLQIKMRTVSGDDQQTINFVIVDYNTEAYPITNPTLTYKESIVATQVTSFIASIIETGDDSVTFTQRVSNIEKYWNTLEWVNSIGYPQTNNYIDVDNNISDLFLSGIDPLVPVVYLHSEEGISTPEILTIVIEFEQSPILTANRCNVIFNLKHPDNTPAPGVIIEATLTEYAIYGDELKMTKKVIFTTTDINGAAQMLLVENESMGPDIGYIFSFRGGERFIKDSEKRIVPNKAQEEFTKLEILD